MGVDSLFQNADGPRVHFLLRVSPSEHIVQQEIFRVQLGSSPAFLNRTVVLLGKVEAVCNAGPDVNKSQWINSLGYLFSLLEFRESLLPTPRCLQQPAIP